MEKWALVAVCAMGGGFVAGVINGLIGFDMSEYAFWQRGVHNIAHMTVGAATWWALTRP